MGISDLLINLAIALIAVDITIYAIGIPLLQTELTANVIFIKRRVLEAREEIKRLNEEDKSLTENINKIKSEIKQFENDIKINEFRLSCLELRGAVIYPCLGFLSTIILTASLSYLPQPVSNNIELSVLGLATLTMIIGLHRLFCTLKSIDYIATNIPQPDFEVTFGGDTDTLTLIGGIKQNVRIDIANIGFDIAEIVEIMIFFHPDIKVHETEYYSIILQPEESNHPGYTGALFALDYIHIDTAIPTDLHITTPKKDETYKIDVIINERKITQVDFTLTLHTTLS